MEDRSHGLVEGFWPKPLEGWHCHQTERTSRGAHLVEDQELSFEPQSLRCLWTSKWRSGVGSEIYASGVWGERKGRGVWELSASVCKWRFEPHEYDQNDQGCECRWRWGEGQGQSQSWRTGTGKVTETGLAEQASISPPGHSEAPQAPHSTAQPGFRAQPCCLLVVSLARLFNLFPTLVSQPAKCK